MTTQADNPWPLLFSPTASGERRAMRLLRKSGRPLMLLPRSGSTAARCLELYPAQTTKAKIARILLRWSFSAGVMVAGESVTIGIGEANGLLNYLRRSGGTQASLPQFGMLAGNPVADTQRFIFLLFNKLKEPMVVVKVGLTGKARELVMAEGRFLESVTPQTPGVPQLTSSAKSSEFAAITLPYLAGTTPTPQSVKAMSQRLSSWASTVERVTLESIHDWIRLGEVCPPDEFGRFGLAGSCHSIAKTLTHGDFAPWNIKVDRAGNWTAIDWERGQTAGVPGWDWFHFVLQHAILVKRKDIGSLVSIVDQLLASPEFQGYAELAGITKIKRGLLTAYLAHVIYVLRPSEGLEQNKKIYHTLLRGG